MAGTTTFDISVLVKNAHRLPETAARAKDLSLPFENIIEEWATQSNVDKFDAARGGEISGLFQPGSQVYWEPLTPGYYKQKHAKGKIDWLMHSTGELQQALTDPSLFGRDVSAEAAYFGMPLNESEQDKVVYNWDSRQTIFLNQKDQLAIKREIKNYLDLGDKYRDILFAEGVAWSSAREMQAQMQMDFEGTVS